MKRSEALTPLSRDHHQALAATLRLRRADDMDSLSAAVAAFSEFWELNGARHFEIEEHLLLGTLQDAEGQGALARMVSEHALIRRLVSVLLDGEPTQGDAQTLAAALSDHVRFEERELFPMIETGLRGPALAQLGERIAIAEAN